MTDEQEKHQFEIASGLSIDAKKIRNAVDKASDAASEDAEATFAVIKHDKGAYNAAIKAAAFSALYSGNKGTKAKDRKLRYKSLSAIKEPALKSAVIKAIKDRIEGSK